MRIKSIVLFAFVASTPLFAQHFSSFQTELPVHSGFVIAALPPVKVEKTLPKGGETFKMFGKSGEMVLYRGSEKLSLALTLTNADKTCEADLTPEAPVNMTPIGKPNGVPRFYSKLKNCDIFVDLLPDAALLQGGACVISHDCKVEATGLWGSPEGDLPLEKSFEKSWTSAEKRMNGARKKLTKKLGTTQAMRDFLSEHLDFNANRLRTCEDYGKGLSWCSLKLTELRANDLETRLLSLK